ncbi:hypothetical protein B9Z35_06845 [Limnohabitans sp. Jir61]|nr:hypothetical protein B9Z35_06845 [Limnohabitans sp. Jir61]
MIVPWVVAWPLCFVAGLAGRDWWASLLHAGVPEIMATPTSHAQSATYVLARLQLTTMLVAVLGVEGWAGDDFWYPSMRNPLIPQPPSEPSKTSQTVT